MSGKRRLPRLSLDLLKGFEAAARHLSFTRAAEELCLSQSAVSREIKTLEAQLGHPLFVRMNRGLRLTEAGQVLYRAVGEALALISEATDRIGKSEGADALRVTTSVPLASMWLVPKLRSFVRIRPDVDVRSVAADQRLDLERERLDVAIRWYPEGTALAGAEPLFRLQIFPVCSPALLEKTSRPLKTFADLQNHVLLDLETVTGRGRWSDWAPWLEAMKLTRLKPSGTLHFSHYDQVVQAAVDGSGIAIGRVPHNARHLREGLLVEPFGQQARISFGAYFIVVRPVSEKRRAVIDFVKWLRDETRHELAGENCTGDVAKINL
jgi:DNA-binding transcriptional LysR family regulator